MCIWCHTRRFLIHYTVENYTVTADLSYIPDENFARFLNALERKEAREWNWLITQFRRKLLPFLRKRTQSYPRRALLSRDQFLEEVIEETLLKFYQLFEGGSFASYDSLEAAVVTTAGYKLKEGFARLRKEQKIYFLEAEALNVMREKAHTADEKAAAAEAENIQKIKENLNRLGADDRSLLVRYFAGEELQDIAEDLLITPAACRKRKQRVLDRLRSLVFRATAFLLLLFV